MREVPAHFEAPGHRYTDAELADLVEAAGGRRGGRGGRGNPADAGFERKQDAVLDRRRRGRGARHQPRRRRHGLRAGAAACRAIRRIRRAAAAGRRSPSSTTAGSVRTLEKKIPVTLQMDIDNKFYDADLNAFNIVAELPGTDKADEVVMLGAHFDSWHTGTGATDNAAGSAVMMEAMRILKTSGVKLRRTVRIGLWGGEEAGLLGSKEYVKAHFGDPATMQLKPEHAKFAGYFNVDNGTGADPRRLPAGQRSGRADLPGVDGAVQEPRA